MPASSNARIRSMDMPILDKVFGMEGGVVLDFSNRTFAEFFQEELGVDIYDSRWEVEGGSKAKRLRYYLRRAGRQTALDTLNALWEYREASSVTTDNPELDAAARNAYFGIIERLRGQGAGTSGGRGVASRSANRQGRNRCARRPLDRGVYDGPAPAWLCV